eukprot:Colp12_sorted_trinity150504_noHs@13593
MRVCVGSRPLSVCMEVIIVRKRCVCAARHCSGSLASHGRSPIITVWPWYLPRIAAMRNGVLSESIGTHTQPATEVHRLEVSPPLLSYGCVREGYTYTAPLVLRNTGLNVARFHVKQPPISSGLRITYVPGPVGGSASAS